MKPAPGSAWNTAARQRGADGFDLSVYRQAEFVKLGSRVSESLTEASQIQKERLESVTNAVTGPSDKLEKAQEALRVSVESRLDAIRQESATKLDEMRQTVDEKLQTTLEARLGESFTRVVEQLAELRRFEGC
jgi:DNA recombination protein RmuC